MYNYLDYLPTYVINLILEFNEKSNSIWKIIYNEKKNIFINRVNKNCFYLDNIIKLRKYNPIKKINVNVSTHINSINDNIQTVHDIGELITISIVIKKINLFPFLTFVYPELADEYAYEIKYYLQYKRFGFNEYISISTINYNNESLDVTLIMSSEIHRPYLPKKSQIKKLALLNFNLNENIINLHTFADKISYGNYGEWLYTSIWSYETGLNGTNPFIGNELLLFM